MRLRAVSSAGLLAIALLFAAAVHAQSREGGLHLRTGASGAFMLSHDQRTWLDYSRPGLLADVQLGYAVTPDIDVQVGATGGLFLSARPGGLAAPMFGGLWRFVESDSLLGYALVDLGIGITGKILRPFARAGAGLEFKVSDSLRIGPSLGLGVVVQWDSPGYSTDAIYTWFGLSCSYWPAGAPPVRHAAPPEPLPEEPASEPEELDEPESVEDLAPAAAPPPVVSSPALNALLEQAVPRAQLELLAPILFRFDSAAIDANAVAMLHQIARLLNGPRKDVTRLEIAAYADARGSPEYNQDLAQRRARHVLEWLMAHGVDGARLQIAAQGAVDFVEPGTEESSQLQNRRVVFRVLETRQP